VVELRYQDCQLLHVGVDVDAVKLAGGNLPRASPRVHEVQVAVLDEGKPHLDWGAIEVVRP